MLINECSFKTIVLIGDLFVFGNWTYDNYEGEDIIQELDGNNQIISTYTHGPGIDEPILLEKNNQKYYYVSDGLSSVTALVNSSGNVVQTYRFDAFGNIIDSTGTINQPFTFTGREYDQETGLYYYRARYYDASTGRFLQEDPIWDDNLYVYCYNNPLNLIDSFGLRPKWQYAMPDFISGNVSITLSTPYTGKILSWSFSGSIDRYGNWYSSIIGPGAGRAPKIVSASITANWIVQKNIPTENQLCNFLSGNGVTVAGGIWGGANVIYSPGNGTAYGVGIVSPQFGGNYSYSQKGPGNTGIKW